MAKLKYHSNNIISGKLGNLVYYQLNGQPCVRSLPSNFKDRKSEKQKVNRLKLKTIGSLFQIFRSALRYEPTKESLNKSAMFCSLNWKNVSVEREEVKINFEELVLSNYGIKELIGLAVRVAPTNVNFQWEIDNLQADCHYVLCIVYAKNLKQVYISDVKRRDLTATLNIPSEVDEIVTYTIAHRRTV